MTRPPPPAAPACVKVPEAPIRDPMAEPSVTTCVLADEVKAYGGLPTPPTLHWPENATAPEMALRRTPFSPTPPAIPEVGLSSA